MCIASSIGSFEGVTGHRPGVKTALASVLSNVQIHLCSIFLHQPSTLHHQNIHHNTMPIDKAFLKPIQIFARDRAKLFRRFPQLPEKIEQIRHEVFDHYMFPAEKGYKSHATQLKHIYINQFNPPNIMKFGRKVRTVLPKKQQNCSFQNLPHNMLTI